MTDQPRRLMCGNDPRAQLIPGDRQAVEEFKAYLADRAALRERIAEALMAWAERNNSPKYAAVRRPADVVANAYSRADAVLSVLPQPADRATVLTEAADALGGMDYDQDSNDYGYDTYRDAWNGGVMDGAQLLRRMAAEPQPASPAAEDLPARLEAVLTERFTAAGNPFSEMRRHEKGPDGWPASHPVGPRGVAEVLRELLDGQQPAEERR